MKTIPLTQNKFAIVDDEDYKRLVSAGSWHFDRYAKRVERLESNWHKKRVVYMHRFITNAPDDRVIDHINGNKLDNRKSNLRVVTMVENGHNRHTGNEYTGVWYDKKRKNFKAVIGFNYLRIDIGRFDTPEEARDARNRVAKQLLGNNAKMA